MRYVIFILTILCCHRVSGQCSVEYYVKIATQASIKQPVPQRYASLMVRQPVPMDSVSLVRFHHKYVATMTSATVLFGGGALIELSHILISLLPHYSNTLVISLAEVGVATMTAGSIALPIGLSERHRYKKSLRIELAKRGL